jgi:hypothetical protein
VPYEHPDPPKSLPAQPASIAWKLIGWAIFLGWGAFGYIYISNALRHDMFAFIEFIAPFPTGLFVLLIPSTKEGKVLQKWLVCLIAFAICLFMYVSVTRSYLNVIRQLTPDLIHQFGLRSLAFFATIFAWVILTPPRRPWDTNVKGRKLGVAISVAVGSLQALFAIQFLLEIWGATSIDQVRLSVRPLLNTGLALYLFVLACYRSSKFAVFNTAG